jgi:hypothetical protein
MSQQSATDLSGSDRGLQKTKIESTDFIETFASLESRKVSSFSYYKQKETVIT